MKGRNYPVEKMRFYTNRAGPAMLIGRYDAPEGGAVKSFVMRWEFSKRTMLDHFFDESTEKDIPGKFLPNGSFLRRDW